MPRNVLLLGLVSFLTDVGTEMTLPILPLFLVSLGAAPAAIGLIEGLAMSAANLFQLLSGWLSDKLGRHKPIFGAGYSLSALAKAGYAAATAWPHVLILRFADRAGKGIRGAPRDALLAEYTTGVGRGAVFGFHRALDKAGAVLGPAIALVIVGVVSTRDLFLIAAIPGFIAVALILLVREIRHPGKAIGLRLSITGLTPALRTPLAIIMLFSLANFSYAFAILRAGELGFGLAAAAGLYLVYNAFYSGLSIPAGSLSDRLGRRPMLALGYGAFAVMCIGFVWADGLLALGALFALFGVSMALTDAVQAAYIADIEPESKGTALGLYHTLVGVAALPASVIAGALWQAFGWWAAFGFGAVLSAAAALAILVFGQRRSKA